MINNVKLKIKWDKVKDDLNGDLEFKKKYLELSDREYLGVDSIILMMKKAAILESKLGKDLYDFQKEDLDRYFYALNSASENYIKSTWSRIKYYMLVAKNKNITVNNLDLSEIYTANDLKEFVHPRYKGKYMDLEDLTQEISILKNYQDKAIFLLPFYGIKGAGFKDMLSFRNEYVDFENSMLKFDNKEIEIDEDGAYILKRATYEDAPVSYTGKNSKTVKDFGYLFKSNRYSLPTRMFLLMRIDMFRKTVGLGNITINSCYISGIACKIIELEKEMKANGELDNKNIESCAALLTELKKNEGWDCSIQSLSIAIKTIKAKQKENAIAKAKEVVGTK